MSPILQWLAVPIAFGCSFLLETGTGNVAKLKGVILFFGGFFAAGCMWNTDILADLAERWPYGVASLFLVAMTYGLARKADAA